VTPQLSIKTVQTNMVQQYVVRAEVHVHHACVNHTQPFDDQAQEHQQAKMEWCVLLALEVQAQVAAAIERGRCRASASLYGCCNTALPAQ
jgi:hypothetical protein